jgi:3-isopropylmalate dehydratase small subunit
MEKFTVVRGIATHMMMADINTDAMSPMAAGRSTSVDLGAMLFNNRRLVSRATSAQLCRWCRRVQMEQSGAAAARDRSRRFGHKSPCTERRCARHSAA